MRALTTWSMAVAIVLAAASVAAQVTKTIPGKTESVTATVEAINASDRTVTVKKPDGKYEVFYVPMSIKRFEMLKVGDKVNAKYYENVVLQLKAPGTPDLDKTSGGVVRADGGKPASTASHQRTITATITAIDPKVPSITFAGPNNWSYSTRVEDKQALAKVKVGDKVDITWTEALVLSLDPAQ